MDVGGGIKIDMNMGGGIKIGIIGVTAVHFVFRVYPSWCMTILLYVWVYQYMIGCVSL